MRIRLSAYIAIQLVPSDWFMNPTGGQPLAAVEHADIVEAEKPALKDVPSRLSFWLTHQVKLSMSLWNTRSRNSMSPVPPFCLRSI